MSVANLAKRFETVSATSPSSSPTKAVRRDTSFHAEATRQIAFPPSQPRSTIRATDRGITSVHLGVQIRQPPAGAPTRSSAERTCGFGEDVVRVGRKSVGEKSEGGWGAGSVGNAVGRPRVIPRSERSIGSDGRSVVSEEDGDDPRAGSGGPAFASRPMSSSRAYREPHRPGPATRSEGVDNEREQVRAAASRVKVGVAGSRSKSSIEEDESNSMGRPERQLDSRSTRKGQDVDPASHPGRFVSKSNATTRRLARNDPSPPESPLPISATTEASVGEFLGDDRTDGVYTYDYTSSSGSNSTTYIDAEGRTARVRRYPPPPADDTAYGNPTARRVMAALRAKGEDADRSDKDRREKRKEPIVIAGRQVCQPGQALAHISRRTLDSTNRANQQDGTTLGTDRFVGISDHRADPAGVRLAKMTGYVPAHSRASSISSPASKEESGRESRKPGSTTWHGSDEEEEEEGDVDATPKPREARKAYGATADRRNEIAKPPGRFLDLSKEQAGGVSKRTPQARKISSEPGIRSKARNGAAPFHEEGYVSNRGQRAPLKGSKSAAMLRPGGDAVKPKKSKSTTPATEGNALGDMTGTDHDALAVQQAWEEYDRQMEDWVAAATAAGYDVSQFTGMQGYPGGYDWWPDDAGGYGKHAESMPSTGAGQHVNLQQTGPPMSMLMPMDPRMAAFGGGAQMGSMMGPYGYSMPQMGMGYGFGPQGNGMLPPGMADAGHAEGDTARKNQVRFDDMHQGSQKHAPGIMARSSISTPAQTAGVDQHGFAIQQVLGPSYSSHVSSGNPLAYADPRYGYQQYGAYAAPASPPAVPKKSPGWGGGYDAHSDPFASTESHQAAQHSTRPTGGNKARSWYAPGR